MSAPGNLANEKNDQSSAVALAQLNELRNELEQVRSARRPTSQFPALTFLLIILLVGLFLYFIYDQTNRFTALGATLREQLVTEVRNGQTAAVPTEIAQRINQKLDYLELRQTAVLEEARNSIQRQSFVFTTVAAFFGLFTVFFGYRQLFIESRGSEAREKHDQEMRGLVRSFQNNITTISSLIATLEQSFAYRSKIEDQLKEIQKKALSLEHHQEETDSAFGGVLDALNRDAMSVVPLGIDRAALNFEENRRRMEAFASRMTVAERTSKDVERRLNPFCYYVRGLNNVISYQYELAIADLKVASRKGREDLAQLNLANYALDQRENLQSALHDMMVSCSYFQGVCYKNLGGFADSEAKFREALERNPQHLESKTYLLQVMFFDDTVPFHVVENEYAKANQELANRLTTANQDEREKLKRAGYVLKINQGDIYYRSPIPVKSRSAYKRFEDPEKAVKCYWEAYDFLPNYLAMFSLAQAMEQVGSSQHRTTTPQELYTTAYTGLKSQVAGDYDRLYSVTLYYMLAACARKVHEGTAASEVFLSQARHSLKEVPTHVTCFSPITRIRLSRLQILDEMEEFEKSYR